MEVEQGVRAGVHFQQDAAAMPSVAAVGTAHRPEFLAQDRHAAVATVTRSYV
jgi:hypothetical protein